MKSFVLLLLLGLFSSQVLAFFIPDFFDYDYNWMDDDSNAKKSTVMSSSKPVEPQKLIFDTDTGASILGSISNAIIQAKQSFANLFQRLTQGVANIFALGTGTNIAPTTAALAATTAVSQTASEASSTTASKQPDSTLTSASASESDSKSAPATSTTENNS